MRSELSTSGNGEVYPNPARGEVVWLNFTDLKENQVQLRVLDMTGREAINTTYSVAGTLQLPLDIADLSGGVYVVELLDGTTKHEHRLIIEH